MKPSLPMTRAQFETRCPACPKKVFEGDWIVRTEDGVWVHDGCEDRTPDEPTHPLCPECFIHHAGECA